MKWVSTIAIALSSQDFVENLVQNIFCISVSHQSHSVTAYPVELLSEDNYNLYVRVFIHVLWSSGL
jgi:hypothetical protein